MSDWTPISIYSPPALAIEPQTVRVQFVRKIGKPDEYIHYLVRVAAGDLQYSGREWDAAGRDDLCVVSHEGGDDPYLLYSVLDPAHDVDHWCQMLMSRIGKWMDKIPAPTMTLQ